MRRVLRFLGLPGAQDLALVVARLALVPGVLQQRNAARETPAALARRLGRAGALDILRWADHTSGWPARAVGTRAP